MTKETLRNHLVDILTDDAPLPREQALDAYTDALWESFQAELSEVVEALQSSSFREVTSPDLVEIVGGKSKRVESYNTSYTPNTNTVEEMVDKLKSTVFWSDLEDIMGATEDFDPRLALENWFRDTLTTLTQHHQDQLREVVNEAIRLSDEAERGHETEFNEWRAFKGFRNGLRDYAKTQGINL